MVAWTMAFDQFLNATLVIEQLEIGWQICEGFNAIPKHCAKHSKGKP